MTLEILPTIDLRGGQCVRLRQGDYAQETVFSNQPVEMAQRFQAQGGNRLHLVDLDGAKAGQPVNHEIVRQVVKALNIPCELGGGLRNDASVAMILDEVGVDRAIIGTAALKEPLWFERLVVRYPGRVALGLDARNGFVATAGWLDVSQTSALELARRFQGLPVAAVIYTNIANDGMMQGVDTGSIETMLALCELGFPVIASGGVSSLNDVRTLAKAHQTQPKLVGAIIGRALYEGALSVSAAVSAAENPREDRN